MKNLSLSEVQAYVSKSLTESPVAADSIRICIYTQDYGFIQYLDVPGDIPDTEITAICREVFDSAIIWEHFSCPERFDGPLNRTPPAPPDATTFA